HVTGVQTCALPISTVRAPASGLGRRLLLRPLDERELYGFHPDSDRVAVRPAFVDARAQPIRPIRARDRHRSRRPVGSALPASEHPAGRTARLPTGRTGTARRDARAGAVVHGPPRRSPDTATHPDARLPPVSGTGGV